MAERRMMAKSIIDTDAFMEMPMSTQCLYFHLLLRADDEGFLKNARLIMRMTGCKDDDMKLLIAKQYIIPFDTGVIVIRHWKIHNYIKKDRFTPTSCSRERKLLGVQDDKTYEPVSGCTQNGYTLDTTWIQPGSKPYPQVRLGKDRVSLGQRENSTVIYRESSPLKVSEEVKNAFLSFSGSTNLNDMKLLSELEEAHGKDRVLEAIGVAEKRGSRRLSYVKGILQNWAHDGYDGEKKPTEWKPDSGHFDPMEGLPDEMRKGWKMV